MAQTPFAGIVLSMSERLSRHSLAKSFFLLFAVIVLIESLIIGILCYDILRMESAAKKQFDAAKNVEKIYQIMDGFGKTLECISEWRNDRSNKELALQSEQQQTKFFQDMESPLQSLREIGANPESLDRLRSTAVKFFYLWRHYEDTLDPDERKSKKLEAIRNLGSVYKQFFVQLRHIESLLKKPAIRPLLGIDPEQLLQVGVLLNFLYLIWLFSYLQQNVRRPLNKLTEACDQIRNRQSVEKSKPVDSEIGILQKSFETMSEQVIDNEKRRNSYVSLFQSVQAVSLNKVSSWVDQLFDSETIKQTARTRLEKTKNSLIMVQNLLATLTDQLESSNETQLELHFSQCKTSKLLQQAAASVEALLHSRKILLELDERDYNFAADFQLISRVVLNLLSNAIKYSPEGGKVQIQVSAENNTLRFEIQDSGPGISADNLEKLFKRFSQLDAVDGITRPGTGLGLAICKELVEAHGGKIGCKSKPGMGSTFWFTLPQEQDQRKLSEVSQPAKKDSELEKKESIKSIKRSVVALLSIFLVTQGVIFLTLDNLFAESAERTRLYAEQKDHLLQTEACYLSFILWGNRMQRAAINMDLKELQAGLPVLKDHRTKTEKFTAKLERGSELYNALLLTGEQEDELINEMESGKNNISEVMGNLEEFKAKTIEKVNKLEKNWKKALIQQIKGFESSYDFSKQLRSKILYVLLLAAVADLVLIAAAIFISMKLVGKVLVLKSKTESFAALSRIKPSLEGQDELSFLDKRLCKVANEILDAAAKRQELMAVINHDLRTPLSSVLGTIENISAGIFGPLESEDAAVVEETLCELETLLSQINDLLLLEKIESSQYVPRIEELSATEILRRELDAVSLKGAAKELRFSFDPETQVLPARADRILLAKAVSVLLKNAVEAAPEKSLIQLSLSNKENELCLKIENKGQGIQTELLKQIFERFRIVDGKAITGFGLPLAYQSCKLQGASIQFLKSDETGTVAELKLKAAH